MLVERINGHFKAHPKLYKEPRYQGIVSYQPPKAAKSKKLVKTSADKDQEDAREAGKVKEVHGTAKTLQSLGLSVDPPPQIRPGKRVKGTAQVPVPQGKGTESDEARSTRSSLERSDDSNEDVPKTPKKPVQHSISSNDAAHSFIIYIHTYRPYGPGTSNIQEPPQSVYLLPNEAYTITHQRDDNGKAQYVARLSQLLPDVIKENSPTKARTSRIYRQMEFPGQPVNFTYIRTVANTLHGRKEDNQLKLDVVNEYILDADSIPNTFICHLWCHPDDEVLAPINPSTTTCTPPKPVRTATAGPSNGANPLVDYQSLPSKEADNFIEWLRALFGEPNDRVWPKAENMGAVVAWRHVMLDALNMLEKHQFKNKQSAGGFLVPEYEDEDEYGDYHRSPFVNIKFTLSQVEAALKMKHTRVQDDRSLFDPKTLNKYPKISAWLDDPEGKYASSKAKKVRIVDDVSGDEEIRPRKKGKARMPRQPNETGWMTAIWALVFAAFHPENTNPDMWPGDGPGQCAADLNTEHDNISPHPMFTIPPIVLITWHKDCIICPPSIPAKTLRKSGRGTTMRLIGADYKVHDAYLLVASCRTCGSRFYPDRITYRSDDSGRLQKLEWDCSYLRISQTGIWVTHDLAVAQEKAIYRFHAGFFNFTEWLNDTNDTKTLTV
ncbi:hypothetical protein PILCRDRAFT_92060 [Piloderma croceum F 1598]|uniref:CxC5 like cysteine cluster associated with KDZ domain-containing protein n=1 Tax=Piloderma croceum (strain F 1598) TaxID=765440 RepID=A0A0C3BDT5_PILCF|nr:hypothetical protein PILCRDRAFT_92060 [Piloderma croceum F 1598]